MRLFHRNPNRLSLRKRLSDWFYFQGDQEMIAHPKAQMQKYFALQALFGGIGMTFMGGMFLMAVYKKIGMDDDLIAYATSIFPTLVTGLTFFLSSMITGVKRIKTAAVIANALHKILLFAVVLMPFLLPQSWQMYGAIGVYMLATLVNGANGIFINTLYVKTIPNTIRGRSVAVRNNLSLVVGLVLPIIGTVLLDSFPDNYTVVTALYTFSFIFAVAECWSLFKVDEVSQEEATMAKPPRFRDAFIVPLRNKDYLKYVFSVNFIVYTINFAGSFGTVYLLNVLGYSYSFVQIVSMLCSLAQMVAYKWAGRLTDRFNPRFIYYFGFFVYAVDAIVKGFTPGDVLKFIIPFSNVVLGLIAPFYVVGTYKRKYEMISNN
ncbi:MAG: MFS transporter, partial [Clostridia bacterium]|nr:MFS transporter [Clostridia bacterium]